ncbi:MAG: ABC transporter ATP-binding protein, partial [Planctomycetota bacterium]
MLTISDLNKSFYGSKVLSDITLEINEGEIFSLLGPSGCGKTTALRIIAGLEISDSGMISLGNDILVDNKTFIPPEQRSIGLVFQEYALFPHLTVEENVAFGLSHLSRQYRKQRVDEAMVIMGVDHIRARSIQGLSGGEQQRVALARSLAPNPKLLLLDESFGSLDASLRVSLREEVRMRLKEQGITTLLVTHDQSEALSFSDRLAVMNHAAIVQQGTPEEVYHNPKTAFVSQFLGQTNLLFGDVMGNEVATSLGDVTTYTPAKGQVCVSVRPEDIALVPGGPGIITARDFKGADCTY